MATGIEALKETARAHEQKEEWDKALVQYKKAIEQLVKEEQPDIGLYNRVADLQVRQGQIEDAVLNYEQAIDLYLEADLPNNAIAVCKKIVRNMPQRASVYLRMGQIRGKQGLIADARANLLTYAERMQAAGNIDEGLRALTELADVATEDVEIRLAIAAQMQSHGKTDDAVAQLQAGYRQASLKGMDVAPFAKMLEQLGATPGAAPAPAAAGGDDSGGTFGDIVLGGAHKQEEHAPEVEMGGFEIALGAGAAEEKREEKEVKKEEKEEALPTFDLGSEEKEEDAGDELPMLGGSDLADAVAAAAADGGGEEEDLGGDLPMFDMGDETAAAAPSFDASDFGESDKDERETDGGGELPTLDIPISLGDPSATAPQPPAAPPALPPRPATPLVETDPMGHASLAAKGDIQGAIASLRTLIKASPDDISLRQRLVEYAFRLNDEKALVPVWLELAEALERTGQGVKAKPVYQQVLSVDPQNAKALQTLGKETKAAPPPKKEVASSEDYVDLGSMLLGDDDEVKTTRFVVAYEEPSGDEQADFAKMLNQFKAKVAESLSSDDVKAHQDLGTAYKEMGLTDEAISEFQQALRAAPNHLPSFELLGQCFMEKGEPDAALRTLTRALDAPFEIEDELLGIYYWLGRAHQQIGNKPQAVEFYDRVFSLDINFADVTERLRALR